MSPAPSRRLLFALAASLGAHGLVWLLVRGEEREVRRPPAPVPPPVEWVEVEVAGPTRTAERPPPEPKPPAVAEAAAPSAPGEDRPRRPPPPPSAIPREDRPATQDATRPDVPRAEVTPPRSDAPRADLPPPSDVPSAEAPRADVSPRADVPRADLSPSDMPRAELTGSRLLLAAREVTAPVDRGDPVATLDAGVPDTQASAQALVQDLVSEGIGRGKVERGLVHPYFSQLGKALMKAWDADRSVKEHGLQGYFDMGMERGRAYSRIWLERAEHYGDSGSFGAKDAPEADRRRPVSTVGDPSIQARRELRQKMREEFRATRRATIRVVQDAQGQLLDVKLVSPSHQPEVDQEAIKDVRAAAEKLPPPPAEAVGNRERITSLWQFELIISISPPIPSFTFEFDEALGFIDTRMPLDRRIYKRVRLLEVR
ncbi:energy transducer TonB family protein [Pyxidicoccus sp. MSG2]|uniref:energy transducer TonB family protein n=1 Tax=Pyxidicoccus sp. MSG2 TaxID=2996790 RepID=UPI002271012C|nr:energy transducer TonB [Pyxidicoccus sp. MSG2]MCY1020940.1 energy transducer TonB [Pyxidicoccus sp. MSG2]